MLKEHSGKTLSYYYQQSSKIASRNFVLIAIILLWNSCSDSRMMNNMLEMNMEQNRKNERANNSVIGLTEDGYTVGIEKMMITAHGREKEASFPLIQYLLVSAYHLTDNLRRTEFSDNNAILKASKKLQTFKEEYIDLQMPSYFLDKNGVTHFVHQKEGLPYTHIDGERYVLLKNKYKTERHELREEKGQQSFNAYLTYLRTAIIKGSLPHRISILDTKIVEYKPTDFEFTIKIEIKASVQKLVGVTDKNLPVYKEGIARQTITAEGYFDIKTKTTKNVKEKIYGMNNLGLHYTKLEFDLQDFGGKKR